MRKTDAKIGTYVDSNSGHHSRKPKLSLAQTYRGWKRMQWTKAKNHEPGTRS